MRKAFLAVSTLLCFASGESAVAQDPEPSQPIWENLGFTPSLDAESAAPPPAYQQTTTTPASVPVPNTSPEVVTLAKALAAGNGASDNTAAIRIYNWVHNNIDYECYYGIRKGSVLTLLDGSGNEFDQSILLADLLVAAGYPITDVRLKIAPQRLTYSALMASIGFADDPQGGDADKATRQARFGATFLSSRGMAVNEWKKVHFESPTSGVAYVTYDRMWVQLMVGGQPVDLDASYKTYEKIETGTDNSISDAIGYSQSGLLSDAGGTSNANFTTGLNQAAVESDLTGYAKNLMSKLNGDWKDRDLDHLIGGRRILKQEITNLAGAFPLGQLSVLSSSLQSGGIFASTSSPNLNRYKSIVTFAVKIPGREQSDNFFYSTPTADLAGRKISLTFPHHVADSANWPCIALNINDQPTTLHVAPKLGDPKTTFSFTVSVTLPGPLSVDSEGNQRVFEETREYKWIWKYAYNILYGFSPSGKWLQKRNEILQKMVSEKDSSGARVHPDDSDEVRTEILNVMGLTWQYQTDLCYRLLAAKYNVSYLTHLRFGRIAQEKGFFIDAYLGKSSIISVDKVQTNSVAKMNYDNVFHLGGLFASAMEHGVIEQMQPGSTAVSTVNILRKANSSGGNGLLLADSSNWADVKIGLGPTGYTNEKLVEFEGMINNGQKLFLPVNPKVTQGSWKGSGWVIRGDTRVGMVINGDYPLAGGYFTGGPSPFVISPPITSSFYSSPEWVYSSTSEPSCKVVTSFAPRNYGADPVNMATGAFEFSAVDMSTGTEGAPRGLSFSRNYSSNEASHDAQNMGFGWTHNLDIRATTSASGIAALGTGSPQMTASFLTALTVAADLYKDADATPKKWGVAVLAVGWFMDGLKQNTVSVRVGRDVFQFTKQADGSYLPPPGSTLTLTSLGGGGFGFQQRLGNYISLEPHGDIARAASIFDVDQKKMTFFYNSGGTLKSVQDSNGRTYSFGYSKGQISTVTESTASGSAGRTLAFFYDSVGNLIRSADPEGKNTYYDYTVAGDPGNTVAADHRIVRMRNHDKNILTQNVYNSVGQVNRQLLFGDASKTTRFYYTGDDNVEVDPKDGATHYFYDDRGRPTGRRDPSNQTTWTSYDSQDRVKTRTSAIGEITTYRYDDRGNLDQVTLPRGGGSIVTKYDGLNRIDYIIDQLNHKTQYNYYTTGVDKGKDRPKFVTRGVNTPAVAGTIYTYVATGAAAGRVQTVTDPDSLKTTQSYDKYGQPDITTAPGGFKTDTDYSPRGDLEMKKDARGAKTSYTYNQRRQLLTQTAEFGTANAATTATTYDNEGRQATVTRPGDDGAPAALSSYTYSPSDKPRLVKLNGVTLSDTRYDERDWPKATYDIGPGQDLINPMNSPVIPTKFVRKENGDLMTSTLPGGRSSAFTYYADSSLKSTTNPGDNSGTRVESFVNDVDPVSGGPRTIKTSADGVTKEYSISDAEGKLTSFTDRENHTFKMQYDELGRKTHVIDPLQNITLTSYGNSGRVNAVLEQSRDSAIYSYNPGTGRPERVSYFGANSATVNFTEYDENGNLKTLNENGAGVISRTYDSLNRVFSYTARGKTIGYRYHKNGLVYKIIYPGGTDTGTGHVQYDYDANGRLKRVTDRLNSVTDPRITSYDWWPSGHLRTITRPNGTIRTIGYENNTGRPNLITEQRGTALPFLKWSMGYYDSSDLKTLTRDPVVPGTLAATPTTAMTYDAANRLATWKLETGTAQSAIHDGDGNMTRGPLPRTKAFADFTYDSRNRLRTAGGLTYTYDAEGLRTGISGNAGGGAETTTFVIDPEGAMSKVLSRTKNGVETFYVYGAGLQYEVTANVATYYHYDQAGNTSVLTDAAGSVIEHLAYSPYGTLLTTRSTGATDTPFLYGGFFGVMTDANGLLQMRGRFYNPLTQRFMNADPARAGWNWYAYANGNPVNWADPSGFGAINTMQAALTAVGFIPGPIGAISNLINGFISMARGDDAGMIQSFTAAALGSLGSIESYAAREAGSIATMGALSMDVSKPLEITAAKVEGAAANSAVTSSSGGAGLVYDIDFAAINAARARTVAGNGGVLSGPQNARQTIATVMDTGGDLFSSRNLGGLGQLHAEPTVLSQLPAGSQPWIISTSNNFCGGHCYPMLQDMNAAFLRHSPRATGYKTAVFPRLPDPTR